MISGAALEELIVKLLADNHPVLLTKVLEVIEHKYNDPDKAAMLKSKFTIAGENNCLAVWPVDDVGNEILLQLEHQNSIQMVTNSQALKLTENKLLSNSTASNRKTIAFDAEFTSSLLDPYKSNILALMQIATDDDVYLLDVCEFRSKNQMDILEQFMKNIFTSKSLMILGFRPTYFFKEFLCKEFKTFPKNPSNYVDLLDVTNYTKVSSKSKYSYDPKLSGLSKVCFEILGNKLDKREAISDWSRRPLREKQITYAALDAVCLLKIYHKSFSGQSLDELFKRKMLYKFQKTDTNSNKLVECFEHSDYASPANVEDLAIVFTYKTGLNAGDIVDVEMNLAKVTSSKDL